MKISYQFRHNDKTLRDFEIDIAKPAPPRPGKGEWTRLSRNKCANCTLRDDQVSHCPPAVDLEEVVDAFNEVISHEDVFVIVDINERHILKDGDAQSGLSALMGLIMANSACPVLGRLRGLTRTHTPFQSVGKPCSASSGPITWARCWKKSAAVSPTGAWMGCMRCLTISWWSTRRSKRGFIPQRVRMLR